METKIAKIGRTRSFRIRSYSPLYLAAGADGVYVKLAFLLFKQSHFHQNLTIETIDRFEEFVSFSHLSSRVER